MKSPFPGMDPYIEERGLFEEFHDDLIREIKVAIAQQLPANYVVRSAERPYVVIAETAGKDKHVFKPDVGVLKSAPENGTASNGGTAAVALAEPVTAKESLTMRAFVATEYEEKFLEIYLTEPERILVTCIEVLSPSNKRRGTAGWDTFIRKRQGLLLGAANYVEIDLLRGGDKFPMLDPWPSSPYTLLVCRRERAPYCEVWPAHFKHPLPPIPVPLATPDPDVTLYLQPMIEASYARSRFYQDINYSRSLTLPLFDDDAKWLAEQLKQRATSV